MVIFSEWLADFSKCLSQYVLENLLAVVLVNQACTAELNLERLLCEGLVDRQILLVQPRHIEAALMMVEAVL